MILSSNLLPEIHRTFRDLEFGNLIPFSCPFKLTFAPSKVENWSDAPTFEASSKYCSMQWKIFALVLAVFTGLGLYRISFDSVSPFDQAMDINKVGLFAFMALCAVFYHNQGSFIAQFFNELLKFEKRNLSDTGKCRLSVLSIWW